MRLFVPPSRRRADPPPLQTDDRAAVLVGTAVWLVLLLVTLLTRDALVAAGRGWWTWSCVAGVALGLVGLVYVQRRETVARSRHPDDHGRTG